MEEKIKILCVDDEENVLKAIRRLFFDEDYEILTASSGIEGLDILRKENVQIIISDYRMPGMSGVDFLKEVRRNWPETVRIVLSGYADIASIVMAINEGEIYKFIPKPWNDTELKITILNAIERYYLYKKNVELTNKLKEKNIELIKLNEELKRLLEKETEITKFQSKVLSTQQNILDMIPVGIIGIDLNKTVVMCNRSCLEITKNNESPIDQNIEHIFPESVLDFVEEVKNKQRAVTSINIYGIKGTLMGSLLEQNDIQKGIILVFIRGDND